MSKSIGSLTIIQKPIILYGITLIFILLVSTMHETGLFVGSILLGISLFFLFIKRPELSLAIQFTGTIFYFYILFKLGRIPFSELTGGFHVFLICSYFLGGALLLLTTKKNFKLGSIDILFVFLFSWLFLSYFIFYTGSEEATKKILLAPLFVIAPFFGIQFLTEKRIKKFFGYCVWLPAVLIIPSLLEYFLNPVFAGRYRFVPFIFESHHYYSHVFASAYTVLILILVIKVLEGERLGFQKLVLIIPSLYLIILSGSRLRLLSLIITITGYFALKSKIKIRYLLYAFVVIFSICIVAYHSVPQSTLYLYSSTFTDNPLNPLNVRVETYKAVFYDFVNNPLFGVGLGNSEGGIGFPHNIFLEVMAELGLVGLLIFLCLFFLTIYKSLLYIRNCRDKESQLLMKISLALFTYSFLVLMAGDRIVTAIGFFLPMGIISSLVKQKPSIKGTRVEKNITH